MLSTIKRHKKIFSVVFIAIAAGGYLVFKPKGETAGILTYTYGTAQRGMIAQSVSGSGQVSVSDKMEIKSKVSGDVISVNVAEGSRVKTGQVIAQLDASDAKKAVRDAQTALESAKLSLDKLKKDSSLSLLQSENTLTQARQTLAKSEDDLKSDYSKGFNTVVSSFQDFPAIISGLKSIVTEANSYVIQSSSTYLDYYYDNVKSFDSKALQFKTDAVRDYNNAKALYEDNFAAYKAANNQSSEAEIESLIAQTYETAKGISQAVKSVNTMIQRYEDDLKGIGLTPQTFADSHLTNLSGYTTKINSQLSSLLGAKQAIEDDKTTIASNQRSLAEKSQSYETLESNGNPLSIRSQELEVKQKESDLEDAKETLADYSIKAPFDGVMASLDVRKGNNITANTAVGTIITEQQIAEVALNEIDVASVETGQRATLSFDAVSDLTITGKVIEVDTIGEVSQGVVSYYVTIAFDTQDERIKPGMSVSAGIITNSKQNVLVVPNSAVKSSGGETYVLVTKKTGAQTATSEEDATVYQQSVQTGLSDDNATEITAGLNEGDAIVVKTSTASKTSSGSTTRSGGSIMNMMGGPGPGSGQVRVNTTRQDH